MKRLIIAVGVMVAILGFTHNIAHAQLVGGPCTYDKHPGTATITKVEKTAESKKQRGLAPYEGVEVKYTFKPDTPATPARVETVNDLFKREWTFFLIHAGHELYPSDEYVRKHDIKADKTFPVTMSVIKQGTCTPWSFDFKDLDKEDLFAD